MEEIYIYIWLALLFSGARVHHYIPYFFKTYFNGCEHKGNIKWKNFVLRALSAHLKLVTSLCLSLSILCLREPDSDRYIRMILVVGKCDINPFIAEK
jgi:hypothetical protein